MAAIQITTALINGQPLSGSLIDWLKLLAGFDLIYTALALALADTILVG
jgi:heme exporter protein B